VNFRLKYSVDREVKFNLVNQLEIGDRIFIRTSNNCTLPASIIGFKHEDDPYPIIVRYDKDPLEYNIPIRWIIMDWNTLRDIKLNRILNEN
jgi:hypothetical protein